MRTASGLMPVVSVCHQPGQAGGGVVGQPVGGGEAVAAALGLGVCASGEQDPFGGIGAGCFLGQPPLDRDIQRLFGRGGRGHSPALQMWLATRTASSADDSRVLSP